MAEKYGTAYVETFTELLKKNEIQVIDICAPSAFHAELAIACARAENMSWWKNPWH
jgi:predicted dehydrogenase